MDNSKEEVLFSVLVANYNNAKYITECLDSILKQTCQNFEIIIVDDCSTDNSVEVIKDYMKNENRIKLFQNQENKGAGYTKKRCIDESSGEICGFVDPDDAIVENALEIMMTEHRNHTDTGLVYSNNIICDSKLNPLYQRVKDSKKQMSPTILRCNVSHFATFKKRFYLKSIQLDPLFKRAVDMDLYACLLSVSTSRYVHKLLYNYRVHEKGISRFDNREKASYWHFMVKNRHLKSLKFNELENDFIQFLNYYRYDVSIYSKFRLLKIAVVNLFK
ncbi:MAG: glycosyltransferase [Flavobacteriaceae bacterium]|jgi:glycosyltransferase involved in cell wall biosynthesis|nr:glycosyltransferase [Flavobacteriaceae bacterium]